MATCRMIFLVIFKIALICTGIQVTLKLRTQKEAHKVGTGYKGNSKYYRSIGQNILITSSKYAYSNGRFGTNSPHGGSSTRNIASTDNLATAKDFYNKLAYGGKESLVNGNLRITRMVDGSIITMRKVSHSDGTPVVDINIERSSHSGGLRKQKIHFIQEDS